MSRYCNSAKQLIKQVHAAQADNENFLAQAGAEDGFGRYRTVEFDKATSKWLAPLLEAADDPRIDSVDLAGKKGQESLVVGFVSDRRADSNVPFAIEEAAEVIHDQESDPA